MRVLWGHRTMGVTMTFARQRPQTSEPQNLTSLSLELDHRENKDRQASKSNQMTGSEPDDDLERMIEAKVAMALRLIKF